MQISNLFLYFYWWSGGRVDATVNEKESCAACIDDYEDDLIVEINHLVASVLCTFGSITKTGRGKNML